MPIAELVARMYRIAMISIAIVVCTTAHADWTFGWVDTISAEGVAGFGAAGYRSDEAALQAARAGYASDYGLAWKHLRHAHDPGLLLSPELPTVGYIAGSPPNATTGNSVAAVCTTLVGIANSQAVAGCSLTSAGFTAATGMLDAWVCWANFTCDDGSHGQVSVGGLRPNCPEDGYGYTSFGGGTDSFGRGIPAHACINGHPGQVSGSSFDPGKCNDCGVGNPISPALGIKSQQEPLIAPSGPSSGLEWTWFYSTKMYDTVVKQSGWSHTYSRRLAMAPANLGPVANSGRVWVYRPDGMILTFNVQASVYVSDADIADRLTRQVDGSGNTSGWTYYVASTDDIETYDSLGRITSLRRRGGTTLTFTYSDTSTPTAVAPSPGLLIRVTDALGRQLNQTYNSLRQLTTVVDSAGNTYAMTYDSLGNLQSVRYPVLNSHGQPSVRTFLYENPTYANALTGIVDEEGVRFSTYTYDSQGRAIRTEHSGGVEAYSLAFNADGSSTVTDPLGTVRSFSYTLVANTIRGIGISQPCTTCGDGAKTKTYDTNGNVTSRSDFNNKKVCYAYDTTRNLETARVDGILSTETCATVLTTPPIRPDVRKVTTTWNANWRLPATIVEPAPGGTKTTTFTYDASGNRTQKSTVAPKNDGTANTVTRTWNWTYGTLGRVATATDPNGKVTTYAYYADNDANLGKRGNVKTVTNPLAHVTQITAYDANARPLTIIDPNGLTTSLTYDTRGRLINRNVGGEQTTYTYDGVGQLTLVTMPDFSTLAYTYDGAHRLTRIQDGLGNRIVYTLDAMGNRTRDQAFDPSNALARTRTRAYDALNRLAQDIGAQAQTTTYGYDSNGNVTSVSDPLSHATGNSYDALNRLVQMLDPANGVTQYAYDGAGNLSQVTDPRGLATVYTYDGLNNLTKLVSPDTGTTTNTYDAAGNLLTKTDARGVTATYAYDWLNRVTSVVYSKSGTPSETHTYTYDSGANAKGRLTQLVDPAATTTWTYTAQGRVASKTQTAGGITHTLTYGYNAAGQLTSAHHALGPGDRVWLRQQPRGQRHGQRRRTGVGDYRVPVRSGGRLAVGQRGVHLPPFRHRWPAGVLGVPQWGERAAQ